MKIKHVKLSDKTMLSGACRCSFPHVFEKHAFQDGQAGEYSITLLLPKDDPMVADLKAMMKAAMLGKFGGKIPSTWDNPCRDGDDKADKYPEMAGHYTLKCSDKRTAPLVVGADKTEIMDAREIYPGCWVRVKFDVFAYDHPLKKGIAFGLRLVQKVGDGEPFGDVRHDSADDLPDLPAGVAGDEW
jgi:hypothetical protein